MGREIRRVPPNWEHPQRTDGRDGYQPLYDETFEDRAAKWKVEFAEWESGVRPSYCCEESARLEFWEWDGGPPDREYFRQYKDEDATWFQLYETVSEGTPVSPPFETLEQLRDYLAANGDFWDQSRYRAGRRTQKPGWGFDAAEAFCKAGSAPSLMVVHSPGGADIIESKDIPLANGTL